MQKVGIGKRAVLMQEMYVQGRFERMIMSKKARE